MNRGSFSSRDPSTRDSDSVNGIYQEVHIPLYCLKHMQSSLKVEAIAGDNNDKFCFKNFNR